MPGEKPRAVLQFNEYDFRHRKVLEILRERPRNKTELVVNAILHYMSCPEAAEEFNKSAMKQMIREVICEMQADGSLGAISAADQREQHPSERSWGYDVRFSLRRIRWIESTHCKNFGISTEPAERAMCLAVAKAR